MRELYTFQFTSYFIAFIFTAYGLYAAYKLIFQIKLQYQYMSQWEEAVLSVSALSMAMAFAGGDLLTDICAVIIGMVLYQAMELALIKPSLENVLFTQYDKPVPVQYLPSSMRDAKADIDTKTDDKTKGMK